MNKKLKNALKEEIDLPMPQKKKEFFHTIQTPPMSYFEFLYSQTTYIRKWTWILSSLIFGISLIGANILEKNMLWCISAFMPLLALSIITESVRSETYGMAEFELSTCFSLKSVILARLGILGIENVVLICLLIPFANKNAQTNILQTSVYILCPYLLTTFLSLHIIRKIHNKEAIYFCTAIAISISFGNILVYQSFPILYEMHSFIWWMISLIILMIGTAKQSHNLIKQTEELVWNL